MSRLDHSAITFPALACIAAIAAWLTLQGFRGPRDSAPADEIERPRYHLEGTLWRRFDETGAPVFEITANSIDYFDDESMQLIGIGATTLDRSGGHWQLSADHGAVAAGEKRLLLRPAVEVRGQPAQQPPLLIQTPELWVDWQSRILSTPEAIVATAPGRRLDAVGMRADWASELVEFLAQVEVRHAPLR